MPSAEIELCISIKDTVLVREDKGRSHAKSTNERLSVAKKIAKFTNFLSEFRGETQCREVANLSELLRPFILRIDVFIAQIKEIPAANLTGQKLHAAFAFRRVNLHNVGTAVWTFFDIRSVNWTLIKTVHISKIGI
jgi:hypothetical protein